jgi:hypothetical protein
VTQQTGKSDGMVDQWCLIELMGHQRMVGKVTEATLAGAGILRIDVPDTSTAKGFTRFVSPSALYAVTPVTEATALRLLSQWSINQPPVSHYEMLPAGGSDDEDQATERDTHDHSAAGIGDDDDQTF